MFLAEHDYTIQHQTKQEKHVPKHSNFCLV